MGRTAILAANEFAACHTKHVKTCWLWPEPVLTGFSYQASNSFDDYNKHVDNCWLIGKFTCDYDYHETFSPEIFRGEPSYLVEFKRKVSDDPSAIKSYKATWRKLARYVQRLEDSA